MIIYMGISLLGVIIGAALTYVFLLKKLTRLETEKHVLTQQLPAHIHHISEQVLGAQKQTLQQETNQNISQLLTPLKERFQEFEKQVRESYGKESQERFALTKEIARIVELNQKMNTATENLTNALKGDNKLQGNWGEMLLEKILEQSGLRPDQDYIIQGRNLDLRAEGGQLQKPDVIVNLPDEKHIIIDAKVSLLHFERASNTEAKEEKVLYLKQFVQSLKTHIQQLSSKHYQQLAKLQAPDFVFMFVPIEGAYSLALQTDHSLQEYAWEKRIVMVCPSTLFATLTTIASLWRIELQNKNAQEIARQSGAMYDKLVGFLDNMLEIGKALEKTQNAYNAATNKLKEGRGNLINTAQKIEKLGAKTSKIIPKELHVEEDHETVLPYPRGKNQELGG